MDREILGTGWKFPIRINSRGGFSYSSGEQLIQEAIWILLGTALGERHMRPQFGCGIHEYVFSPNEPNTRGDVAFQVQRALATWEPRIDVLDVTVEPGDPEAATDNLLLIRVHYRIRSTNTVHNLVYPFYIQGEQTNTGRVRQTQ
jgi:phage baseplate assembly protein W